MLKRLWLVAFICLGQVWLATAQEPPPEQGVIFQYSARVFFPAAIEFRVSVATQAEFIRSGTLTLFQASGYEAEFPVVLPPADAPRETAESDIVQVDIDTTGLMKLIEFEDLAQLRPFEPLNYRWEFVTGATTEQTSTVADQVLFQPEGLPWQFGGEPPFTFWWYNPRLGVEFLREELLPIYRLLQTQTGEQPSFQFALFEPEFRLCENFTDPQTEAVSEVYPGNSALVCSFETVVSFLAQYDIIAVYPTINDFEARQNLLIDTVVRSMYGAYWGSAAVPEWFVGGLSQFYRRTGNVPAVAVVRAAATQNQLLTVEQLTQPPAEKALWEAQSYLFLLYLADNYGAKTPFDLALALKDASSFEAAFQDLTGNPLAADYRAFQSWLNTQDAEIAAAWNPYLPDTPTPTATRTNTPIPPSDTPTNTPTITITPSSTSLIGREPTLPVLSPTVSLPTLTATPSNTPLPPGSLRTPTPLPTTPPPAAQEDGNNLPCGAAALMLPAVGIVLWSKRWL